ncbi:uncharacterized protein EURHEDRAFT_550449 [Aspergillus ruber CBS 135680]|uniref:Uncharacterized protein n=1 Tax=Aspergillus ruber (strain CBS 135680) TaxID=1388766 RepID=A0A017S0I8_ASPRC|nr:uncharacterized protein EURHEDRAFT_550449 [Aspergillus ruber CBS 135680]EYE90366.1 hypothetical protein EURHEDRAFT_550449 [Aspergillus ruber CBS 135680]
MFPRRIRGLLRTCTILSRLEPLLTRSSVTRHIGTYTLPARAGGIQSSQLGFAEHFLFKSEGRWMWEDAKGRCDILAATDKYFEFWRWEALKALSAWGLCGRGGLSDESGWWWGVYS